MKIEKNARGWQVSPSTSEEQAALEFILKALEETYATAREVKGVDLASYSPLEVPAHSATETAQ